MTDAADGGIADRGGGRGSYRVINFDAGKFCSGHIVRPVYLNRCPYARARGRAAATTGKNKATANQSPRAQALPIKGLLPKGRLRINDWIVQRPYNDTVKETVEL